jgi:hypothetical protein
MKRFRMHQHCLDAAAQSPCAKLKFGAVATHSTIGARDGIITTAYNAPILATRFMCINGCIRLEIPSRLHPLMGGCCHAEELLIWDLIHGVGLAPSVLSQVVIWVAGMTADGVPLPPNNPPRWTCLRCATTMALARIQGVRFRVGVDLDWHWSVVIPPELAIQHAYQRYRANM